MVDVLDYGEPVKTKGFNFMNGPGYDPVSVTGQVASGANIICFTTGRGSCFGFKPTPSIKIATNTNMYKKLEEDMDINAGTIMDNEKSIEEIGNEIFNKIDIIFGTHAIFQKKVSYKKLGLIIIDEQHKFGVNQRKKLSDKGGDDCDVLLMTATPIPRTLTMTMYGDMDLSIIKEKPKSRKPIKTYSKLESKIDDVLKFIKKEINSGNQIFWVCPLIEESKKLDHSSAVKKFDYLNKLFPNQERPALSMDIVA